jgi:poly(hydroxyalkanoate) granule-associated protein
MAKKKARKKTPKAADRLRATWKEGLDALGSAEAEVRRLMSSLVGKKGTREVQKALRAVAARLAGERQRAEKELQKVARALQSRVEADRRALVRFVHKAIQGTLASLNIPSRSEIVALTRKVDELSRKVRRK